MKYTHFLNSPMGRILESSSLSLKYMKAKLIPLCWIVAVCFPLYYFVWKYIWPEKYESITLRLIGSAGFALLFFIEKIEHRHKKLASFIWFAVFTYALSFFFQFMLLKNEISPVWVASTIIGVLLISVISYDSLMLYAMYILGTVLACFTYYIVEPESTGILLKFLGQLPIQGFCLFFSVFLNSKSEQLFDEKRKILEANNLKLIELDQKKDNFLANTSHELRTPLNGILGLTKFLITELAKMVPVARIKDLELILQSGNRLNYLINDILDFSKMRKGDFNITLTEVNLHDTVSKLQRLIASQIRHKDVLFVDDLADNLPTVLADENRLQQILYNLIGNAIKFTHHGQIRIYAEVEDKKLKICVADTGIGIPPDKLEAVFNAFEQADGSISRSYGGTGLGLSVTRQLVELHQGEVGVTSTQGEGSTFYFTLPIVDEAVLAEIRQRNTTKQPANNNPAHTLFPTEDDSENTYGDDGDFIPAAPNPLASSERLHLLKNAKVLVVDDDGINITVAEHHLTSVGVQVIAAFNGQQAIELIKTESPDLVLLDIMMPGMNGYEVAEKIRAEISEILPIIMLTALQEESGALHKGFMAGANDFLSKPYDEMELFARLESALHQQALMRAEQQVHQDKMLLLKSLAAGIAHEIKTPLGLIMGHAQVGVTMMNSAAEDYPTKVKAKFDYMYRVGVSAEQIINLILSNMKNQVIDNSQFARLSALTMLNRSLAEYGFGYKFNQGVQEKFSVAQDNDFDFMGSDTIFIYMMFNLLKNALYYLNTTPNNHIEIWLEPGEENNKLYFKDYGPGINPEILPHIFESFMSTGKKDGTGLGLPFCKRAMESFGGDIICQTEKGKYTMFILSFPKIG